jgi:hypothetical protein
MQFELTYQVPWGRLTKLSRSVSRKAFPDVSLLQWLLLAGLVAASLAYIHYDHALDLWMRSAGIPLAIRVALPWVPFAGWIACFILVRRWNDHARSLMDFDLTVHLTKDDGGVRIATEGIEYYLKWRGISRMMTEPDGVAVLCANIAFLVPDAAFPDATMRLAFIRDVYGHLTENARAASEEYIRPVLDQSP